MLFCAMFSGAAERAGAAGGPTEALAKAVERLAESPEIAGLKGPGPAALTAMALIAAGSDPSRHPLREAVEYVERQAFMPSENQYIGTYTAAVGLTLLHMAGRDSAGGGAAAETLAKQLVLWQEKNGSWGDVSRSQFAALGLYAARAMGVTVPSEVFRKLRGYILSMQNTNGGWPYRDKGAASTGSMTSGALAALHIVERAVALGTHQCTAPRETHASERAIRRGLEWLAANQSYLKNPGDAQYYYYYLYSLERSLKYLGIPRLGEHDWYSQAAERLVRMQGADGAWAAPPLEYANQFAVLFLSRSGWPAAVSKLVHDNEWNLDPYDAEILSEELSRRLHMPAERRIISLDEPVDYLLQSPLIYVTGRSPLRIADENKLKLAEYVEKGGTLFFAPSYRGKAFIESVKAMLDGLFPDDVLAPLPPDDPLYLVPNSVDAVRLPVYGIVRSCRVCVILTEAPVSCALSGCSNADISGYPAEDMKRFAVNAGYYALGVGGYLKKKDRKDEHGFSPLSETTRLDAADAEFLVGWLRYKGDWQPFLEGLGNVLRYVNRETERLWWWREVRAEGEQLHKYPLLYITGSKAPKLSKEEKDALRKYVEKGGRIIAEPACGSREFVGGMAEVFAETLPECRIERIMPGHEAYSCLFEISRVRYKDVVAKEDPKLVYPWFEGVFWQGRLVAMYSPFNLSAEWADKGYAHSRGVQHRDAFMLGANLIAYFFLYR